ncbi:MAG: alpha/beta fold hydrolase [Bacteroidales bacterium]|nr:alpha/beta fold hydrolase [Bacteroidales bacterium]
MNKIHYRIKGTGPALVLLHGFMESSEMWHPFLPSLVKDFSVVMIDLPGHGKSYNLGSIHSMEAMAETVKSVLNKESISKCTMTGHSMGGYVGLAFAKKYPTNLNGLVLLHSHPDEDSEEARKNRDKTIDIIKKDKKDFISTFIPSLYFEINRKPLIHKIEKQIQIARSMKPEGIIAALRGMKERKSSVDFLHKTNIPVLFIVGKQDSRVNINRLLELIAIPEHCECLILGHVAHMGFHEAEYKTMSTIHHFGLKCAKV